MAASNLALISGSAPAPAPPAPVEDPTPPPVHLMSLSQLVEELEAFENTVDMVPDAERPEFLERFRRAYTATAAKLDRTQYVRLMLDSQIASTQTEITRLRERGDRLKRHLERMDANLVHVIKSREPDARGKYKPLEGTTVTFAANRCPPSVQILDEEKVPATYKTATITLPLKLWDELVDALDLDRAAHVLDAIRRPEIAIRKDEIKTALKADTEVPGAGFAPTRHSLVVK